MLFSIEPRSFQMEDELFISSLVKEINENAITELNADRILRDLIHGGTRKKLSLIITSLKKASQPVTTLDISHNNLGEETLAWLVRELKGSAVRKINIAFNGIRNIEEIKEALKESDLIEIEGLDNHPLTIESLLHEVGLFFTGQALPLKNPSLFSVIERWLKETISLPTSSQYTTTAVGIPEITIALIEIFSKLPLEGSGKILKEIFREANDQFSDNPTPRQALHHFCIFLAKLATRFLREGAAFHDTYIAPFVTQALKHYSHARSIDEKLLRKLSLTCAEKYQEGDIDEVEKALLETMQHMVEQLPDHMLSSSSPTERKEIMDHWKNYLCAFLIEAQHYSESLPKKEIATKGNKLCSTIQDFLFHNAVSSTAAIDIHFILAENSSNEVLCLPSTSGREFLVSPESQRSSTRSVGTDMDDFKNPPLALPRIPVKRQKFN